MRWFWGAAAVLAATAAATAPVRAAPCGDLIESVCLERLGAGALALEGGACAAQLEAYRGCLNDAASSAQTTPADPTREATAKDAFDAVKDSGDPEALRLVARRFEGTFWGDLAAREAEKIEAGAVRSRSVSAARPRVRDASTVRPLDPIAARMMAGDAGEALSECVDCPPMIALPGGAYLMGSTADEAGRYPSEGPQRRVTLRRFALSRDETTYGQWRACAAEGFCRALDAKTAPLADDKPLLGVSWADVTGTGVEERGFIAWLNSKAPGAPYRLPSEAEWEYAARAGTISAFPWGEDYERGRANGLSTARFDTTVVGSFPANAFGLRDMIGNAQELTEDCWNADFETAPRDGTAWRNGRCDLRVIKGGAYLSEPRNMRAASRLGFDKDQRGSALGFRVARDLVRRGPER